LVYTKTKKHQMPTAIIDKKNGNNEFIEYQKKSNGLSTFKRKENQNVIDKMIPSIGIILPDDSMLAMYLARNTERKSISIVNLNGFIIN